MNRDHDLPGDEIGQASEWWVRLNDPACTELDRAAFRRWRGESATHDRAWREVETTWRMSALLQTRPAVLDATREALHTADRRRPRRRRRWRVAAAVAATVAALVIGAPVLLPGTPATWVPVAWTGERYMTATAQQERILLPDGSTVLLDAESTLHVRYSLSQRDLVLNRGQAQFKVARDAQRPFVVKAADGSVRAIGTEFQVRVVGDDVVVTLLEGEVAVDMPSVLGGLVAAAQTTRLQAGEQVRYSSPQQPIDKAPADIEGAEAWPQGELVFKRWKLDALVEEMNRHTPVKIRIEDPGLRALVVNGRFRAGDQRALILALEHQWPIQARRLADGGILLERRIAG